MMLNLVPAMKSHLPPHLKAIVRAASGSSFTHLAAMAAITFDQLVTQSGINPTVVGLFKLRGMDNTSLMYHMLEKPTNSESIPREPKKL